MEVFCTFATFSGLLTSLLRVPFKYKKKKSVNLFAALLALFTYTDYITKRFAQSREIDSPLPVGLSVFDRRS